MAANFQHRDGHFGTVHDVQQPPCDFCLEFFGRQTGGMNTAHQRQPDVPGSIDADRTKLWSIELVNLQDSNRKQVVRTETVAVRVASRRRSLSECWSEAVAPGRPVQKIAQANRQP